MKHRRRIHELLDCDRGDANVRIDLMLAPKVLSLLRAVDADPQRVECCVRRRYRGVAIGKSVNTTRSPKPQRDSWVPVSMTTRDPR